MTDRPILIDLLDAVRQHLDSAVIPAVRREPKLYFQTLVASNLLRIAQRELTSDASLRELRRAGLAALLDTQIDLPRNAHDADAELNRIETGLCAAVRRGDFDSPELWDTISHYVGAVVNAQLLVNNPGLAQRYAEEDQTGVFPR